jgi:uncharacterized protein YkwD
MTRKLLLLGFLLSACQVPAAVPDSSLTGFGVQERKRPTPKPSLQAVPSQTPRPQATIKPTPVPTITPTSAPTVTPTAVPSVRPTPVPTPTPTPKPTPRPTFIPTPTPSFTPTSTPIPTAIATPTPTALPSPAPTETPTPSFAPTANPTPIPTATPTPNASEPDNSLTAEILRLTNLERGSAGLGALTLQPLLNQAAQAHADTMVSTGQFSHVINGLGPADRVTAAGYSWRAVAENIAYGYSTPAAVMTGWMNSSGHRANILGANYTELGVGMLKDSQGRAYWVQVFGRPR